MSDGRLFHARGPATANAWSLMVERRVEGTTRSADDTERKRRRAVLASGDRHCQLCQISRRRSSQAMVHDHDLYCCVGRHITWQKINKRVISDLLISVT